MDVRRLIGLRVKALRRSQGMSQEVLAEKMGISPKYLSSIERGKENPTLDTFIKLADSLGIELSEIFNLAHEGKSARELRSFISEMTKGRDEESLKLAARIIRAIYF